MEEEPDEDFTINKVKRPILVPFNGGETMSHNDIEEEFKEIHSNTKKQQAISNKSSISHRSMIRQLHPESLNLGELQSIDEETIINNIVGNIPIKEDSWDQDPKNSPAQYDKWLGDPIAPAENYDAEIRRIDEELAALEQMGFQHYESNTNRGIRIEDENA